MGESTIFAVASPPPRRNRKAATRSVVRRRLRFRTGANPRLDVGQENRMSGSRRGAGGPHGRAARGFFSRFRERRLENGG
ncbi:Hypothetical protein SMAX5B_020531 [Scophthalmus maximus]|uniref:Uncharacterized protein n=1 Tax=Scophthalmus maximus TaxID=52904 RepID=A0A2U9CU44_SCOMX|nr:Hypothetical protein SMAX5B_020531 [Scophthalmus maximus]KAF0025850.1 hypothetical protein F2P81_022731 [Scophthalmus maximus]